MVWSPAGTPGGFKFLHGGVALFNQVPGIISSRRVLQGFPTCRLRTQASKSAAYPQYGNAASFFRCGSWKNRSSVTFATAIWLGNLQLLMFTYILGEIKRLLSFLHLRTFF